MANSLKTYPAPWTGEIVLACRKCQKKLKGYGAQQGLAKLKKAVKRYNREHSSKLHVINVPCMDLCPKEGVTVCCPKRGSSLVILRNEEDLQLLRCRQQEGAS